MNVKKIWTTPDGDKLIAQLARVSNPANQDNHETAPKLINYLIRHKHWSPFEMVSACVEIETTRDIGRQILRHRSFSFQEFSQRYAEVTDPFVNREARLVGATNRQSSVELETSHGDLLSWWDEALLALGAHAGELYDEALKRGIAPECARVVLPEGLTPTRMYMVGSLRSWIHYWGARVTPETQKEHRLVAEATAEVILREFPMLKEALATGQ